MPLTAPLCVPVELQLENGRARWFRLAIEVAEDGLLFGKALPGECEGPLAVSFFLPDDEEGLSLKGRIVEIEPREGSAEARAGDQRRGLVFIRPDEESRARIARYVEARLLE